MAIFGGVQFAIDAILVSAHHCDRTPLKKADMTNGIVLQYARKRKEDRCQELFVSISGWSHTAPDSFRQAQGGPKDK